MAHSITGIIMLIELSARSQQRFTSGGAERARDRSKASCKSFAAVLASLVRATEIIAAALVGAFKTHGFGHSNSPAVNRWHAYAGGDRVSLFGQQCLNKKLRRPAEDHQPAVWCPNRPGAGKSSAYRQISAGNVMTSHQVPVGASDSFSILAFTAQPKQL